jgi:dTDP-4-dehydrorhamnose 3,5-epimerase
LTNLQPINGFNRAWISSLTEHTDNRGIFMELSRNSHFADYVPTFVQDSLSKSNNSVLRGLHVQIGQWQLISVLEGEILDIAIDLRRSSNTYLKINCSRLNSQKIGQILLGPGIAHGYQVLSDKVLIHYKSSKYYGESEQYCIDILDDLFVDFLEGSDFIRSERDVNGMKLSNFLANEVILKKMEIEY